MELQININIFLIKNMNITFMLKSGFFLYKSKRILILYALKHGHFFTSRQQTAKSIITKIKRNVGDSRLFQNRQKKS